MVFFSILMHLSASERKKSGSKNIPDMLPETALQSIFYLKD